MYQVTLRLPVLCYSVLGIWVLLEMEIDVLKYLSCMGMKGAFMYIITLNSHRNLQGGYYDFQVTGEHMTLEGDINVL